MQTESVEYKIYLEKLKDAVTGRYSRIKQLTGLAKSTISDVLNGKIKNTDNCKIILKAAVQVRDEKNAELKKKEEAFTKLIS